MHEDDHLEMDYEDRFVSDEEAEYQDAYPEPETWGPEDHYGS